MSTDIVDIASFRSEYNCVMKQKRMLLSTSKELNDSDRSMLADLNKRAVNLKNKIYNAKNNSRILSQRKQKYRARKLEQYQTYLEHVKKADPSDVFGSNRSREDEIERVEKLIAKNT